MRDAAARSGGFCENADCRIKLPSGGFHYDHVIPDWMGGEPTLENCEVLCLKCHRHKTSKKDVPAIAKVKRIIDKNHGIKKRSKFQTNRNGPFKKKMNGQVIRRGTE